MRKPSKELKNLYSTYLDKRLRPQNALEFASNFILDLINAFGEKLEPKAPVTQGFSEFAPFHFLLLLNELLARYKEQGLNKLDDTEKTLLHDTHLMLATLVSRSLAGAKSDDEQERYQLPDDIVADLKVLID